MKLYEANARLIEGVLWRERRCDTYLPIILKKFWDGEKLEGRKIIPNIDLLESNIYFSYFSSKPRRLFETRLVYYRCDSLKSEESFKFTKFTHHAYRSLYLF